MDNILQLALFFFSVIDFMIFVFVRFYKAKDRTIKNTFVFENEHREISNILQLSFLLTSSICSIILLALNFSHKYANSLLYASIIVGIISMVFYLILSVLNLNNLRLHMAVFAAFVGTSSMCALLLGISLEEIANLYQENLYYVYAVILYFIAGAKVIMFLPRSSDSLKLQKDENGELKRPTFVRLAFNEWLFKIISFIDIFFFVLICL